MRLCFKIFYLLLFIPWPVHIAHAQVKLPQLISDNMVLQRGTPLNLWGWAAPGEKINLTLRDKHYTTRATAEGKWYIAIPPIQAGGPYKLDIQATNHITIHNILFGDVWICSGQSNMALTMERLKEKYGDIIAQSENPAIRYFFIPTLYDFKKAHDDVPATGWMQANPANVMKFSATAYFFARSLYEKYRIPIGLINASVGGTPVEAWLSPEALKEFPPYHQEAMRFQNDYLIDSILHADRTANRTWHDVLRHDDAGYKGALRWYDSNYHDNTWPTLNVPGYWSDQGVGDLHGVLWFRKEIDVPASMVGKPAKLFLGCIVDSDSTYINGTLVGAIGYRYPPRRYDIGPDILKPGKNIITIRVINSAGKGGFVEDKNYQLVSGGETIDLRGAWRYHVGAGEKSPAPTTFIQYKPGGLFNAMIAPLLPYPIKGVIWYQGESNTARASAYAATFRALIHDWRKHWHQGNFPFLYVQLANYQPISDSERGWAELREAQRQALDVPNTAMAVTIDIGEWNDLHPLNKQDVGKRLALAARKTAYGEKILVYSGPLYQSMKIEGKTIRLYFTNTGTSLSIKGTQLNQFTIAGEDGKFVPATARIKGKDVIVSSSEVLKPVSVRYAWSDNPIGANLYNKEGLPAAPFKTD
jgi:sialate O-acetylesterase